MMPVPMDSADFGEKEYREVVPGCSHFNADTDESCDDSVKDGDYVTESEENSSDVDTPKVKRKRRKLILTNGANLQEDTDEISHAYSVRKPARKVIKGETRAVRSNRKKCRNLGIEYLTRKGKKVKGKECKELQACRMKCRENIDFVKREKIFTEFWAMGDFNKRVAYIAGLISSQEKNITKKKKMEKNTRIEC